MSSLANTDPEVADIIEMERLRQTNGLELIASENIVSKAVLETTGSILTNKYAEGYPGKRYYGGCEYYDIAENLARDRLCQLFGAEHANVQAHSGSGANMAVYFSTINYGDKIMSMKLSEGGHLSHGSPVSFSGKMYKVVQYGVDHETERLDYADIAAMARKEKPQMIVCGASAYPREIDFKAFGEIAEEVGAYCVADIAHIAGLVAAGLHNSPIDVLPFTTTTTHKTLRGPRGGAIMCKQEYAQAIDKAIFPGLQGGPLMHIIAAKAVCFGEALKPSYKEYCKQIIKNAQTLAATLDAEGLRLVSGGTDNHLMLIDLTEKGITGKEAGEALDRAGITVNKNMIPFDKRSPMVTSGIRLGTPAITTRGMKEPEMVQIARMIAYVLKDIGNEARILEIRKEVQDLCSRFPLYPERIANG